jgi:hypothetical protein
MTSLLILDEDEPNPTADDLAAYDVVIEIDANGDGHVVKNTHGKTDLVLCSTHPSEWRDFVQGLAG